jgi:prepilin-type N-terminal cleavage/methylation domain-containing protein
MNLKLKLLLPTLFCQSSNSKRSNNGKLAKLTAINAKNCIGDKNSKTSGFSLIELLIAMTLTLILLGVVSSAFSAAMRTREREIARTDALASAQAALNVMSREIANAGFGLTNNGIVLADSNSQRLHIRSNVDNSNSTTSDIDEDITYYYDATSQSVVRYNTNPTGVTSALINQVSTVTFQYFDYTGSNSTPAIGLTPTTDTGRVRITLTIILPNVTGQVSNQTVTLTSDVTLRNSTYMLNQY